MLDWGNQPSKTLAGQLDPDAIPAAVIGKRLTYGTDEKTQPTLTIVGVTGDFPTSQMSTERAQRWPSSSPSSPASTLHAGRRRSSR